MSVVDKEICGRDAVIAVTGVRLDALHAMTVDAAGTVSRLTTTTTSRTLRHSVPARLVERSVQAVFIFDTSRIVCGAGFMKRSSVCPSVCPVDRQQQQRAGGFAAERPAGRR